MKKVIFIKNWKDKNVGDIDVFDNNIVHGLIDSGTAVLFNENTYQNTNFEKAPADKMMRTTGRKKYKIKEL